jgi:hypothetical protein
MRLTFKISISLAPGFSPVLAEHAYISRFNGFCARPKAAEAASMLSDLDITGLKPGANGFENTP